MKKLIFSLLLLFPLFGTAQLTVSRLFSDHAVLQRDLKIPVWGWATKGQKIEVTLNGQSAKAKAGKDGKWRVTLPPMPAGGPFTLTITNGKETLTRTDILLGDVWVCSGQSNMEWLLANSRDAKIEIANATDPQIRHFKVPHTPRETIQDTLAGGEWVNCSPEVAGEFTAVGYFFARELRKSEGVPIGLLNTSWGGSRIEPWMRVEALASIPGMEQKMTDWKAFRDKQFQEAKANLEKQLGKLPEKDLGMAGEKALWADPKTDATAWKDMELPALWEDKGLKGLDGFVWFRKTISLDDKEAAEGVTLHLGMIDDSDISWINGKEIGRMEQKWNTPRVYKAGPEVLKPGENVIVIRVDDTGGGGGIYGEKELLKVESSFGNNSLAGNWKYKVGEVRLGAVGLPPNHTPTLLWKGMVAPVIPFGIKGAIWYQGESNAAEAKDYQALFPKMIEDWRTQWNQGEFPFLWVQLANFLAAKEEPGESTWAELREAQSMTLSVPNTAEAVIIDIGEAADIHPRNKQDVGLRLALGAQKLAYGKKVVYSGPRFASMEAEKNAIRIKFDHTGSGLVAHDKYGYLKGFAIAGPDKKFVWAMARIEGDEVVVWSPEVPTPVAVRYGWADNPDDVNVYNKEGLPASPFRTDEK